MKRFYPTFEHLLHGYNTDIIGRRQEWDDLREQHWNMYITICEIDHQSRFEAWDRVLKAGALGWPWGMGWGGRWEGGSGWGTHERTLDNVKALLGSLLNACTEVGTPAITPTGEANQGVGGGLHAPGGKLTEAMASESQPSPSLPHRFVPWRVSCDSHGF